MYKVVGESRERPEPSEPPDDFLIPLYGRLSLIRLVADESTSERAVAAIEALHRYTFQTGTWEDVEHRDLAGSWLAAVGGFSRPVGLAHHHCDGQD